MTWLSIIIAGLLTYFTRMAMIALVGREMLSERVKEVLAYVPSAVFPAIIFPAIFINDYGKFVEIHDPKIFAAYNCNHCWIFFEKYNFNYFIWIIFLLVISLFYF
jgi:branched-subunit amino acid transport protein